jgi:phosphatidate cytidylyltransferase
MLKARILTAAVLLGVFLAALFLLPPSGWTAVVVAVLAIAAWEWAGLAGLLAGGRSIYAAAIAMAAIWVARDAGAGASLGWIYMAAGAFWLLLAPAWLWRRPVFRTPVISLAAGAIILVPSAAAMVALRESSPGTLLAIMAVVWISDTAAYFFGHRFGRRKLAATISPGKTWEGVYGALASVTVYAIGWLAAGGTQPVALRGAALAQLWFVILLVGLAALGVIGDLLESQMKRQAGVKDSGTVLPGHGGILDRIDALLPVLPLAALAFLS